MPGRVIAGTHRPVASLLRVPGHGHLRQPAACRAPKIAARAIARTDHVVNALLDDIRLPPAETCLVTPDKKLSSALSHRVVTIGRFVIERVAGSEILHGAFRLQQIERSSHAVAAVGFVNLLMAADAGRRVNIGVSLSRNGERPDRRRFRNHLFRRRPKPQEKPRRQHDRQYRRQHPCTHARRRQDPPAPRSRRRAACLGASGSLRTSRARALLYLIPASALARSHTISSRQLVAWRCHPDHAPEKGAAGLSPE